MRKKEIYEGVLIDMKKEMGKNEMIVRQSKQLTMHSTSADVKPGTKIIGLNGKEEIYKPRSLKKNERKMILFLSGKIDNEKDDELQPYTFKIKEYLEFMNIPKCNYNKKAILRSIKSMATPFWVEEKPNEFGLYMWLQPEKCKVNMNTETITICLNRELKRFFLNLKEYTTINFKYTLNFTSGYTYKVYMYMKNFTSKGHTTSLPADKAYMFLGDGVYDKKHLFCTRVLDKAQEDMEKYSDIHFSYRTEGRGKNLKFFFYFFEKTKDEMKKIDSQIETVYSINEKAINEMKKNISTAENEIFKNALLDGYEIKDKTKKAKAEKKLKEELDELEKQRIKDELPQEERF